MTAKGWLKPGACLARLPGLYVVAIAATLLFNRARTEASD